MNKKSRISLGPGAPSLILIFVVLCLAALGMLCLMTGRNDLRLSRRSAEVAEAVYQLREQAEQHRAELSALARQGGEDWQTRLPAYCTAEGDTLFWQETDGTRTLDCALALVRTDGALRTRWTAHTLTAQIADNTQEMEEIWN